jgi:hypothetical protein
MLSFCNSQQHGVVYLQGADKSITHLNGGYTTSHVRVALGSPPSPPPLWLWLLLLLPRRQQECLLCALGLLPPGIAFLAQVLYLVFSVMEQHHQHVALAFPDRFFMGVRSFSWTVFSTSLRTNLRDSITRTDQF